MVDSRAALTAALDERPPRDDRANAKTPLYIGLGWAAIFFIPHWVDGAKQFPTWVNVCALTLVAVGGVLYTLGAVVYASQKPNPSPTWFGFHEVFHAFTIAAFVSQYIGVSMATYALR